MPLLGRAAVPVEGAAVARPRMRAEKMIDRQPVLRAGIAGLGGGDQFEPHLRITWRRPPRRHRRDRQVRARNEA